LLGDGTMMMEHMLCTDCASKFGRLVDEPVLEDVWSDKERYPYVRLACAQCFNEWSADRANWVR
jgi:hypothetical protein